MKERQTNARQAVDEALQPRRRYLHGRQAREIVAGIPDVDYTRGSYGAVRRAKGTNEFVIFESGTSRGGRGLHDTMRNLAGSSPEDLAGMLTAHRAISGWHNCENDYDLLWNAYSELRQRPEKRRKE